MVAEGAVERDDLCFVAGCGLFALTVTYFGLLAFGGAHVLDDLRHALFGG